MAHVPTLMLFRDPRMWSILFLSFASGLPFLLTLATLHVWLKECGLANAAIGLFALVTLPYSLKFLWAPFLDTYYPPFIGKALGRRKGWMVWSQVLLIGCLVLLGQTDPHTLPLLTAIAATATAFFSATQDITIEAYRIEVLESPEYGLGASFSNIGYRLGMWVSGAGALYMSSAFNWGVTYNFMAATMGIGIVAALMCPPIQDAQGTQATSLVPPLILKSHLLTMNFIFQECFRKVQQHTPWAQVVMVILGFKMVDTFLNVMAVPFMLDTGFSKIDIANVGKTFGIAAMVLGGLGASLLLARHSIFKVLVLSGILQLSSALMYICQHYIGADVSLLFVTMGIEQFASGMAAASFVTYLSLLCRRQYTATHYAFLSSMASFARVAFSYLAGLIADWVLWKNYFLITAACCIAYLCILTAFKYVYGHFNNTMSKRY